MTWKPSGLIAGGGDPFPAASSSDDGGEEQVERRRGGLRGLLFGGDAGAEDTPDSDHSRFRGRTSGYFFRPPVEMPRRGFRQWLSGALSRLEGVERFGAPDRATRKGSVNEFDFVLHLGGGAFAVLSAWGHLKVPTGPEQVASVVQDAQRAGAAAAIVLTDAASAMDGADATAVSAPLPTQLVVLDLGLVGQKETARALQEALGILRGKIGFPPARQASGSWRAHAPVPAPARE